MTIPSITDKFYPALQRPSQDENYASYRKEDPLRAYDLAVLQSYDDQTLDAKLRAARRLNKALRIAFVFSLIVCLVLLALVSPAAAPPSHGFR